jgi:hypothetical protein
VPVKRLTRTQAVGGQPAPEKIGKVMSHERCGLQRTPAAASTTRCARGCNSCPRILTGAADPSSDPTPAVRARTLVDSSTKSSNSVPAIVWHANASRSIFGPKQSRERKVMYRLPGGQRSVTQPTSPITPSTCAPILQSPPTASPRRSRQRKNGRVRERRFGAENPDRLSVGDRGERRLVEASPVAERSQQAGEVARHAGWDAALVWCIPDVDELAARPRSGYEALGAGAGFR